MEKFRFLFAATVALVTLLSLSGFNVARAFDISAYWDPISMVQLEGHGSSRLQGCPGDTDRACWINSISVLDNADVLRWYQEMGITNLCVHYRPSDFQTFLGASGESLAVMNERWPNRMYQYLEAQGVGRKIVAGDLESPYLDPTNCTGSYGCNAFRTRADVSVQLQDVDVLAIGPGDSTIQEFWRPRVAFGRWKGWARREVGEWTADSTLEYVMPIRVRLVCDIDPPPEQGDSSVIAIFRWMRADSEAWSGDSVPQVLYYPLRIRACAFDASAAAFDTITLRIDPIDYTAARHSGDSLDSAIVHVSNPYDTTADSLAGYGGRFDYYYENPEGRFSITFCDSGGRTFYLYSVEAMDDAYWKMFEAPDTTVQATETMIADSFQADLNRWPGHMRGWYYDEIYNDEYVKPWVHVNRILRDNLGLTFFINGFAFDDDRTTQMDSLYSQFAQEGNVRPQTFMLETYYFWGDSTGVGLIWNYPAFLYTRTSSDGLYADTSGGSYLDTDHKGKSIRRFHHGTQSLQRAIDWTYWDVS